MNWDGREQEMNMCIGAASAVMWTLYWSIMVKKEPSCKAKMSISMISPSPMVTNNGQWTKE